MNVEERERVRFIHSWVSHKTLSIKYSCPIKSWRSVGSNRPGITCAQAGCKATMLRVQQYLLLVFFLSYTFFTKCRVAVAPQQAPTVVVTKGSISRVVLLMSKTKGYCSLRSTVVFLGNAKLSRSLSELEFRSRFVLEAGLWLLGVWE